MNEKAKRWVWQRTTAARLLSHELKRREMFEQIADDDDRADAMNDTETDAVDELDKWIDSEALWRRLPEKERLAVLAAAEENEDEVCGMLHITRRTMRRWLNHAIALMKNMAEENNAGSRDYYGERENV
jgi:DNA-directed RNA polymerase specialized sigma subunit